MERGWGGLWKQAGSRKWVLPYIQTEKQPLCAHRIAQEPQFAYQLDIISPPLIISNQQVPRQKGQLASQN